MGTVLLRRLNNIWEVLDMILHKYQFFSFLWCYQAPFPTLGSFLLLFSHYLVSYSCCELTIRKLHSPLETIPSPNQGTCTQAVIKATIIPSCELNIMPDLMPRVEDTVKNNAQSHLKNLFPSGRKQQKRAHNNTVRVIKGKLPRESGGI